MDVKRLLLRSALGPRLPITSGSLRLRGVRAPLVIRRDKYGIAYIEAQNDDDAWFGLGFCQGQDRAFQLELRQRLVRGTLSALAGAETLPIDRLSRRIGLFESSQRQLTAQDDDVRAQIEAFARGINAAYESGLPARPHEFVLLRSRPTPWQAADVIGIGKMMSLLMIGNWDVELARLKILMSDGEQALRDLDPSYPEGHPVSLPPGVKAGPAADHLGQDFAAFAELAGLSGGASNNWAINGSRTRSGRPLLANDPHLDPILPPHWYLAQIRTPDWAVAGASLIGSPAIGAGHNGFAAWGITAGLVDIVDLFLEDVAPDGRSVRRGDAYESCEVRREVIEVRGGTPVVEEVIVTPRGPIISPALTHDLPAISMRAVWLDPKPARGFLRLHEVRSFDAFRRQFEHWPLLPQNVAYADTTGSIAWQLVGEVPRRRKGYGTLPAPGWDPEAGWEDAGVPFEAMPFALDPERGFIASANNKPVVDNGGPFLGVDWLDGYRVERIFEALAERDDWDVDATQALQLDVKTLAWREIRDPILSLQPSDEAAVQGLELLRDWDGIVGADSPAATVYELFVAEMQRRISVARAPKSYRVAMGEGFTPLLRLTTFAAGRSSHMLRLMREQPRDWFDRGWPDEMCEALVAVVHGLRRDRGEDSSAWAWGSVRPLTLRHPLGRIEALAPIFNRGPFAWGGDGTTVSQAGTTPLHPEGNPTAIASLRMVLDVGEWEKGRFSLPGGQSGNPFSSHYDDLLPLWLRGEGVPIAWLPEDVRGLARETLRLAPL